MYWRIMAALAAGLAVANCGGNPFGNEPDCGEVPFTETGECAPVEPVEPDGTDTDSNGLPDTLEGNLKGATFNPTGGVAGTGSLTLLIDPLDASPVQVEFVRAPTLDVPNFQAFTYQETSSNRLFVALFDTSTGGAVSAGATASGQFSEMVWGSTYAANEAFVAPPSGAADDRIASFSGSYAGFLNSGAPASGPGGPLDPIEAFRTEGDVFVNADFTNMSLEGSIYNRTISDTTIALDDLFLEITEIDDDGTFLGSVVFADRSGAGDYGGTFGGNGSGGIAGIDGVAGGVNLTSTEVTIGGNSDTFLERGVFVADQCAPGDPAPCPPAP